MEKVGRKTSVLRFGVSIKKNSNSLLKIMGNHNFDREHVINQKEVNIPMINVAGSGDYRKDLEKYEKDKGIDLGDQRKDCIRAREIVLSLSPTVLRNRDPLQIQNFILDAEAWLKEKGFDLVTAQVHLDEDTPHLHGLISSTNTYKDRHGNNRTVFNIQRQLNMRYERGSQKNDLQTEYNHFMRGRGWDIEDVDKKSKAIHVNFAEKHLQDLEAKVKELSTALREKALKYKAVETVINKIDKGLLIKLVKASGIKVEAKSTNMDMFLSIDIKKAE